MHELSIIVDLVALCEEHAQKHEAKAVDEIIIKVGRLSGVEPHYLYNAFEFYRETSPLCSHAKLTIHEQPLVVACQQCGQESELQENDYQCLTCGSRDLKVIDGEDMYLMQIVMH